MAFRTNGPTMLALPAFRGFTRRIVLIAGVAYLIITVLSATLSSLAGMLLNATILFPAPSLALLWTPVTYSFVSVGLANTFLALLSVWMFGSSLEDDMGSRWFAEFFFAATIGGGLLAVLVAFALRHIMVLGMPAYGMWPAGMAILLAFARFNPDREIFLLVLRVKARHVATLYLLVYLIFCLIGDRFSAITALSAALCGYAYIQLAPRRGMRFAASETWFGWRNAWYRMKRRRAAKKFTVYMREQGRDVNINTDGRYVDPSGNPRDPNDRRWMN